uniref:Uncharacterized protein n=1 Tax=Alexandrium monilatum TaxID=311494 RepID=A0A7S4T7L5_9DINO
MWGASFPSALPSDAGASAWTASASAWSDWRHDSPLLLRPTSAGQGGPGGGRSTPALPAGGRGAASRAPRGVGGSPQRGPAGAEPRRGPSRRAPPRRSGSTGALRPGSAGRPGSGCGRGGSSPGTAPAATPPGSPPSRRGTGRPRAKSCPPSTGGAGAPRGRASSLAGTPQPRRCAPARTTPLKPRLAGGAPARRPLQERQAVGPHLWSEPGHGKRRAGHPRPPPRHAQENAAPLQLQPWRPGGLKTVLRPGFDDLVPLPPCRISFSPAARSAPGSHGSSVSSSQASCGGRRGQGRAESRGMLAERPDGARRGGGGRCRRGAPGLPGSAGGRHAIAEAAEATRLAAEAAEAASAAAATAAAELAEIHRSAGTPGRSRFSPPPERRSPGPLETPPFAAEATVYWDRMDDFLERPARSEVADPPVPGAGAWAGRGNLLQFAGGSGSPAAPRCLWPGEGVPGRALQRGGAPSASPAAASPRAGGELRDGSCEPARLEPHLDWWRRQRDLLLRRSLSSDCLASLHGGEPGQEADRPSPARLGSPGDLAAGAAAPASREAVAAACEAAAAAANLADRPLPDFPAFEPPSRWGAAGVTAAAEGPAEVLHHRWACRASAVAAAATV